MPAQQRLDCETMTKVVQAWPVAGRRATDANLSRNPIKDPTDLSIIEPTIVAGAKKVRGLAIFEQTIPACSVVLENLEARCVERNQPGLAELGVTDRKNAFGPVDIGGPEIECLADA